MEAIASRLLVSERGRRLACLRVCLLVCQRVSGHERVTLVPGPGTLARCPPKVDACPRTLVLGQWFSGRFPWYINKGLDGGSLKSACQKRFLVCVNLCA